MAHLGTQHQVHVMHTVKLLHKLGHGLPCPLAVMILAGLVHATVGQEALLHAVSTDIFGEQLFLTHGVGVLVGILAQRVRVFLQTKL